MKRRSFLSAVSAGVGALFFAPKIKSSPKGLYRDHAADSYPIIHTSAMYLPPRTSAIVRIFGRIEPDGKFDDWFYDKGQHYPNGRNHSDFSCFDDSTLGDTMCFMMGHGSFLNNWTFADWSFLQADGSWRNWNTFIDADTGELNDFSPSTLALAPQPLYGLTRICFINRYEFIMFIHENADKVDKIRMNGVRIGTSFKLPYNYAPFRYRKFIPAKEWITSSEFEMCAAITNNISIWRVERFPIPQDSTPEVVEATHSTCHWTLPQTWCNRDSAEFREDVFNPRALLET